MPDIRLPAVAGTFYPADPHTLRATVSRCLAEGRKQGGGPAPKALIAPHAGYVYSGPVAGSAYALLEPIRARIRRVVLLGPSHRVPFRGLALPSAGRFQTPLGEVEVDRGQAEGLEAFTQVRIFDAAHAQEHSLEVQLPFLQELLSDFSLVPIAAGDAEPEEVAEIIEALWGGPETLVLVSSDLSHYEAYETARRLDLATSKAIEELRPEGLGWKSACGRVPVRGLLVAARRRGLSARIVDLRNSGDTAGSRDQVVGYGAYAFS